MTTVVVNQDLTVKQGEQYTFTLTVPDTNDALTGRTLLSHWRRLKSDTNTQLTLSTANGRLTVSAPRYAGNNASMFYDGIYGRLTDWAPIKHTGGDTYECTSITLGETPVPAL